MLSVSQNASFEILKELRPYLVPGDDICKKVILRGFSYYIECEVDWHTGYFVYSA